MWPFATQPAESGNALTIPRTAGASCQYAGSGPRPRPGRAAALAAGCGYAPWPAAPFRDSRDRPTGGRVTTELAAHTARSSALATCSSESLKATRVTSICWVFAARPPSVMVGPSVSLSIALSLPTDSDLTMPQPYLPQIRLQQASFCVHVTGRRAPWSEGFLAIGQIVPDSTFEFMPGSAQLVGLLEPPVA